MQRSFDGLLKTRLSTLSCDSIDRGGGGDCFFHVIACATERDMKGIRSGVAQLMRENELVYGQLGDFTSCGGYQKYCDLVRTCGVFGRT